ncbi:arylsulfatase [Streptomyces sp. Je 1-79]|uniref:arylsulfatase n=1 Tax=Streptomyces sp. Je 1-79 TaxID=2943847 RepID=UPI0021A3CA17|nr:arylsulfatase [Streptomyces sp. Je 1-79]MCT4353454.1 arylsulfatase [Streptomyces sp. Je 1-79]
MSLALLHTSEAHVPVFDGLRDRHHPGLALRHLVVEELLVRARAEGPEAVAGAVRDVLAEAVAGGAEAVLCTCSTLGGVAERHAAELGVPVLRVDRPMAVEAVRASRDESGDRPAEARGSEDRSAEARGRVVVVATVESTLAPTLDLLREESGDRTPSVATVVVDGAWERFLAGDRDGYLDAVAAAVDRVDPAGEPVIVLAQASMADATERTTTPLTVLSSPRLGLAAAATAVCRHG